MLGIEREIEFMLKVHGAFVSICPTALASGRLHFADIKDARQEQTIPNVAYLHKRILRSVVAPGSKVWCARGRSKPATLFVAVYLTPRSEIQKAADTWGHRVL